MTWVHYQLLTWCWIALGFLTFLYLLRVDAPFGRHTRTGWGPMIDNRAGWVLMEFTVLVVLYLTIGLSGGLTNSAVVLLILVLFTAHYIHRSLIFPHFLRTGGKQMPVVIVLSAMGFNTMNGFLIGYYFSHFAVYPEFWMADWRFLLGISVFLTGAWINVKADYYLIRLRKPGETGYKIPRGGWFNYLSCPNHFGEILEWSGLALLSWSLPFATFTFWTAANLVPRALAHHAWYRSRFPDYPAARKAVFPFLL
ncbi:MAG: DUF1295 domain-containing protein [Bacteroidetes bacterium]|nr:MAG: DUF1295 domain-containing protein [Bacteroidota bacterium]